MTTDHERMQRLNLAQVILGRLTTVPGVPADAPVRRSPGLHPNPRYHHTPETAERPAASQESA